MDDGKFMPVSFVDHSAALAANQVHVVVLLAVQLLHLPLLLLAALILQSVGAVLVDGEDPIKHLEGVQIALPDEGKPLLLEVSPVVSDICEHHGLYVFCRVDAVAQTAAHVLEGVFEVMMLFGLQELQFLLDF
jgi:hypothetical protein